MKSLPSASISFTLKIYGFPALSVFSSPVQVTVSVPFASSLISAPGTSTGSPPAIFLYSLNHTVGLGVGPFTHTLVASASPSVGIL